MNWEIFQDLAAVAIVLVGVRNFRIGARYMTITHFRGNIRHYVYASSLTYLWIAVAYALLLLLEISLPQLSRMLRWAWLVIAYLDGARLKNHLRHIELPT